MNKYQRQTESALDTALMREKALEEKNKELVFLLNAHKSANKRYEEENRQLKENISKGASLSASTRRTP